MHRAAALALSVESLAILAWWAALVALPTLRGRFLAAEAPFATLLAFVAADAFLVALGFAVAVLLVKGSRHAFALLCVRAGAAIYAGLYALCLPIVGDGGALGALLMMPVLLLTPTFAWLLRPRGTGA